MKVYISTKEIKGANVIRENPLPVFRDIKKNNEVANDGTLTKEQLEGLGYETGFRVLPYSMQDRYNRNKKNIVLKTIVLENDVLRAEFLSGLGGRLYSLSDKSSGRELLFKNSVFQPANLAIRNAWFSGGIEWNIGQIGHTYTTCSPMFFAKMKDEQGDDFLRMYEYERVKKLYWQIDFHLPKGSRQLYAYVRIVNNNDYAVPMYWWTNIAVREEKNVRVFSDNNEVIYQRPLTGKKAPHGFGRGNLPYLDSLPGKDASYPQNFNFSTEYFFQNSDSVKSPWEAAAYNDGFVFFERSTQPLRYRKMFCWGTHRGGRKWCDFLSEPGKGDYLEIQGGIAPTQNHSMDMPGKTEWSFTQAFGWMDVEPKFIGEKDWNTAKVSLYEKINSELPDSKVALMHKRFSELATNDVKELLTCGSGWGALEERRLKKFQKDSIPKGFKFPEFTLGEEQLPWLNLLETGKLPEMDADVLPKSWMVDKDWEDMLIDSIKLNNERNWADYLHLGVMLYENGRREEGVEFWKKSINICPTALAYRNIAKACVQAEDMEEALNNYEISFGIEKGNLDKGFAEDYIDILVKMGKQKKAWDVYCSLPDNVKQDQRIRLIVSAAAVELDQFGFLEGLFEEDMAVIREGEVSLSEIWYLYTARKLAKERNIPYSSELLDEAKKLYTPPREIDFRMTEK